MSKLLNITQVSKLTGLDVDILRNMRCRESVTLLSGPPFCKTLDASGLTHYVYKRHDVLKWLKRRSFRITAGDAAAILGISRIELLAKYGSSQHNWKGSKGELVISAGKNIFIWRPKLFIDKKGSLKKAA